MDRYTAACSCREVFLTRLMRFQSTCGFTPFPSARGSSPPKVSFLLEICGIFDGYTAVRSFFGPRLAPPPEGFLSPLLAILSPPGDPLWPRGMNDALMGIRLCALADMDY